MGWEKEEKEKRDESYGERKGKDGKGVCVEGLGGGELGDWMWVGVGERFERRLDADTGGSCQFGEGCFKVWGIGFRCVPQWDVLCVLW
jgi:hypothetical protein